MNLNVFLFLLLPHQKYWLRFSMILFGPLGLNIYTKVAKEYIFWAQVESVSITKWYC